LSAVQPDPRRDGPVQEFSLALADLFPGGAHRDDAGRPQVLLAGSMAV